MLTQCAPSEMGLEPNRWLQAQELVQHWCDQGELPAAALQIVRGSHTTGPLYFGRQSADSDAPPLRHDAIFLVASITKPVVAAGALLLAERGLLCLDDRVHEHLPEFGRQSKYGITIRHLLTHTSGLPDMLPQNLELRRANAPLDAFLAATCELKPDFAAGRGVQYQSLGLLVLSEIISRISQLPTPQFLQNEFFQPLGMTDTVLGAPDSWFDGSAPTSERIAGLKLPPEQLSGPTWNWHSRYWRQLGAPWGGLLTTPGDLARYAALWLNRGTFNGQQILSPSTVAAATRNQLDSMKDIPADDRRCRPWGLGWRLNWPAHSANFGDFLSPSAYGHWGATGTALWIDPERDVACVFLTTLPQEPDGKYLARLSNAVCSALL